MTFYYNIEWVTRLRTSDNEVIFEQGIIPVHLDKENTKEAQYEIACLAQDIAVSFEKSSIDFYYKIT